MSKSKKMTMKRFKEVIAEVYPTYELSDILSCLERQKWDKARESEAAGRMAECYLYRCDASKLHSALEEIGYYDEV